MTTSASIFWRSAIGKYFMGGGITLNAVVIQKAESGRLKTSRREKFLFGDIDERCVAYFRMFFPRRLVPLSGWLSATWLATCATAWVGEERGFKRVPASFWFSVWRVSGAFHNRKAAIKRYKIIWPLIVYVRNHKTVWNEIAMRAFRSDSKVWGWWGTARSSAISSSSSNDFRNKTIQHLLWTFRSILVHGCFQSNHGKRSHFLLCQIINSCGRNAFSSCSLFNEARELLSPAFRCNQLRCCSWWRVIPELQWR